MVYNTVSVTNSPVQGLVAHSNRGVFCRNVIMAAVFGDKKLPPPIHHLPLLHLCTTREIDTF